MAKSLVKQKSGELQKFDPENQGQEIAASEKAIQVALKQGKAIKDPELFDKALDRNLSAKREAAREYRGRFGEVGNPSGNNQYRRNVETSFDNPRLAFCRALGFSDRTVQKWCDRLLDDERYKEYFKRIRKKLVDRYCLELQREKRKRKRLIESVEGLEHGDFRVLSKKLPDNSVDLIFTDPPYGEEGIILYEDAAKIAARVLVDGGSFIAYCGQTRLMPVLESVSKYLRYWWICACVHSGKQATRMFEYGVVCKWKPMIWFVKGTRGDKETLVTDVVSGGQEKEKDSWQQSQLEAEHFIDLLVPDDGLIVDFFAGSGTTLRAAQNLKRRAIGYDL